MERREPWLTEEQAARERASIRRALIGRSPKVVDLVERFVDAHGIDRLIEVLEANRPAEGE